MAGEPEIVPLTADQLDVALALLGRAFAADPLYAWILPDPAERAAKLPSIFGPELRYCLRAGALDATAGELLGLAAWTAPDRHPGRAEVAALGVDEMLAGLGPANAERLLAMFRHFGEVRRRCATVPHWYLQYIAVDPSAQGQGLGSRLLRPGLERADADGRACYLETLEPRNLTFYRRHGFELVEEGDQPSGPHYWAMLRPPRA